jgi:hypothetical protein
VFKCYCSTPTCILVVLLVFRRVRSSFIASWTSTYRDCDIARFRLRVSVKYIGSAELYIFSRVG